MAGPSPDRYAPEASAPVFAEVMVEWARAMSDERIEQLLASTACGSRTYKLLTAEWLHRRKAKAKTRTKREVA